MAYAVFGKVDILEETEIPVALTIGNFDGVHTGHAYLISKLKKTYPHSPCVVLTFNPHPATLFVNAPIPLLTSVPDKVNYLLKLGVDVVVVQNFSKEFSQISADDFCLWLHENFNIEGLLLGHDFNYGKGKSGNYAHMQTFATKFSWQLAQADTCIDRDAVRISSSLVKQYIVQGDMEATENLLGRPYALTGIVVKGQQQGRQLGFPTANISLATDYVVPKYGVYACYVEINADGNLLPGVLNCGIRPAMADGHGLQIEAHIFNFSQDIYKQNIKFYFKKYLREERKFKGMPELIKQITQDAQDAKNYLSG